MRRFVVFGLLLFAIVFGADAQKTSGLLDTIQIEEVVTYGELRKYQSGAKIESISSEQMNLAQEGGIGNVSISKILSTPSTPTELGEGVKIEYTGDSPITLVVDTADGYDATIFTFGYFGGYYDMETPSQWESIPIEKIDGTRKIFMLTMPSELQKSTIGHTFGSTKYWIETLKPTASIIEQKRGTNHQNSLHYKKFIAEVPSSIKTAVETKRKERYLREVYVKSGAYYSGFWSRPFGIGVTYEPTVHLTLPPKTQQIAHEMGVAGFDLSLEEVYEEMRSVMPSIAGISWERLKREGSVTYPCQDENDPGQSVVFVDDFVC